MKSSLKNWTPTHFVSLAAALLTAAVTAYGIHETTRLADFNRAVEIYNSAQKDRGPLEYWARDTVLAHTRITSVPNLYAVKDLYSEEITF